MGNIQQKPEPEYEPTHIPILIPIPIPVERPRYNRVNSVNSGNSGNSVTTNTPIKIRQNTLRYTPNYKIKSRLSVAYGYK